MINVNKLMPSLTEIAARMQTNGWKPPYALLSCMRAMPKRIHTPYGEFRCYYNRHIPETMMDDAQKQTTVYAIPMELYRQMHARNAAFARWHTTHD